MLSFELQEFCRRWTDKSGAYRTQDLNDCFDKFFTLFVVYNRLYMEAAWSLVRDGGVELLPGRRPRFSANANTFTPRPFSRTETIGLNIPDSFAAKQCVRKFLGASEIWSTIQNDANCREAVQTIRDLIDKHVFAIKLDGHGEPVRSADARLLDDLQSNVPFRSVMAILDIIYSIRCNMFHGHKGYEPMQTQLLVPVTVLLEKITTSLYEKLNSQEVQ